MTVVNCCDRICIALGYKGEQGGIRVWEVVIQVASPSQASFITAYRGGSTRFINTKQQWTCIQKAACTGRVPLFRNVRTHEGLKTEQSIIGP